MDRCSDLASLRDSGLLPLRRDLAAAHRSPPDAGMPLASSVRGRTRIRKPSIQLFDPQAHTGRIVLKIADDGGFEVLEGGEVAAASPEHAFALEELLVGTVGLTKIRRVFSRRMIDLAFDRFCGERWMREEMPDLTQFLLLVPREAQAPAVMESLVGQLNDLAFVEIAYFEGRSEASTPPVSYVRSKTEPLEPIQGYLFPAPQGIDAYFAWSLPGGTGQYSKIIDVEVAWRPEHEDLPPFFASVALQAVPADDPNIESYRSHGTAVLGMLAGNPANLLGIAGIANASPIGVAATYVQNSTIASAIDLASATLVQGDVILVERQIAGPPGVGSHPNCGATQRDPVTQSPYVPAEYDYSVLAAIRTATANGRVVVAAAGNGGVNLDDAAFAGRFDPASPDYLDSGAILVGARWPDTGLPTCESNYGSRIDASGWGRNVVTTYWSGNLVPNPPATLNNTYSDEFGGTSSAAPMVAGAAALVQSIQVGRREPVLSSMALRALLRTHGTAQAPNSSRVGLMPDLFRIQEWMTADSDGDGVKNGVELALGRNPNVNEGGLISLIHFLLEE